MNLGHESRFFQTAPTISNTFISDPLLKKYLSKKIPKDLQMEIFSILEDLGDKAAHHLLDLSWTAEQQPPELISYDAWGNRIDQIQVSAAWLELQNICAEYGIVATGYERTYGDLSRLVQMSLLYLFHPSSAFMSCPMAMTDGAARAIELYGSAEMKRNAFRHLTTRDPMEFWTSGQWMTEKIGGSDVSQSETMAKKNGDHYELFGTKWFTSATTSPMAMTLARTNPNDLSSKGLSLFYVETHDEDGALNQIEIHRLKNKLGTKALPTAELSLKGSKAYLVGDEGNGVKKISSLFNITRIYNSVCCIGHARRALDLAWNYSKVRKAFGRRLMEHPLHVKTLLGLEKIWRREFWMTMKATELWGKDEVGEATVAEKNLLRVLTPLVKLWTAKKCVQICSEVIESFGGAGYVEDTGLPVLLRDAQVFPIWEGTTNILSLDLLRAFEKENGFEAIRLEWQRLKPWIEKKSPALNERWNLWFKKVNDLSKNPRQLQTEARNIAFELAQLYGLSLEIEVIS